MNTRHGHLENRSWSRFDNERVSERAPLWFVYRLADWPLAKAEELEQIIMLPLRHEIEPGKDKH